MRSSEFCYWLQGYFEINEADPESPKEINEKQVEMIQRHLSMVFVHDLDPKQVADKLQQIHDGNNHLIQKPGNSSVVYRC